VAKELINISDSKHKLAIFISLAYKSESGNVHYLILDIINKINLNYLDKNAVINCLCKNEKMHEVIDLIYKMEEYKHNLVYNKNLPIHIIYNLFKLFKNDKEKIRELFSNNELTNNQMDRLLEFYNK